MNKDEPEVALEYLKKVDKALHNLEHSISKDITDNSYSYNQGKNQAFGSSSDKVQTQIDPNYKATLSYNLACCYQRLGMLEECVDYLEAATKALKQKISNLEEEENANLLNHNHNSTDLESNDLNQFQHLNPLNQLSTNSTTNDNRNTMKSDSNVN